MFGLGRLGRLEVKVLALEARVKNLLFAESRKDCQVMNVDVSIIFTVTEWVVMQSFVKIMFLITWVKELLWMGVLRLRP